MNLFLRMIRRSLKSMIYTRKMVPGNCLCVRDKVRDTFLDRFIASGLSKSRPRVSQIVDLCLQTYCLILISKITRQNHPRLLTDRF